MSRTDSMMREAVAMTITAKRWAVLTAVLACVVAGVGSTPAVADDAVNDAPGVEVSIPRADIVAPDGVDPYLLDVATGEVAPNPSSDSLPSGGQGRSTVYKVACTGQIQDPHFSTGAGGAIAKLNVKCTGTGASAVTVRTRGLLTFAASSSPSQTKVTFGTRATSDYSQSVTVNGKEVTFYLPQPGSNGGRGTGFWRATFTWQITSLPGATVGSDTKTIWRAI
jgi:hypothetical protein